MDLYGIMFVEVFDGTYATTVILIFGVIVGLTKMSHIRPWNCEPTLVASMITPLGDWDLPRMEGIILDNLIRKVATTCPPQDTLGNDRPRWCWEETRVFSTRSAYTTW
ncbi:hypothetical protein V6N11_068166 [Hibiscus sabdariffa]|uniref:Uncharacterized protein n=1 Tax=Hibiscus sabdariffa TaxID=183260 RepID=A0ABR2STS6_9ROSI